MSRSTAVAHFLFVSTCPLLLLNVFVRVCLCVSLAEFEVNQINKSLNALAKEIGAKKKAKEDATELMATVAKTKEELKAKEEQLKALEKQVQARMRMVGNIVHESVPVSKDEADNVITKTWGECKRDHAKYHHHELLHMIDGYAAEKGVTVAGHRGYFLKGQRDEQTDLDDTPRAAAGSDCDSLKPPGIDLIFLCLLLLLFLVVLCIPQAWVFC